MLILGGYGNTGRLIADYLLHYTSQRQVVLGGRNLEKAQNQAAALNQRFPGERVSAVQVDASDQAGLKRVFRGQEMVIAASSTAEYTETIARAAIETGIDYFDVQYSTAKLRVLEGLREDIEKAGCCFITEGGFHPGLPAAMIRYAARQFDCLESAHVGSVIKIDWKTLEFSSVTLEEFTRELLDFDTTIYHNGQWVPQGWTGFRAFDFGGEFGQQKAMAMMLEELRPLPQLIPDLKEIGFYVGSFNPMVDMILMPFGFLLLKIAPKKGVRPFSKMLLWGLRTFSRPPYGTILQLEAHGVKEDQPHMLRLRIAHDDGYVLTAVPVVAALMQYEEIRKPGLWMQGLIVEPVRFFDDMKRMGIQA